MATLALSTKVDGPGKGRFVDLVGMGSRTLGVAFFTFSFDNSYPTGGEDISATAFADLSPWSIFRDVVLIQPILNPSSAGTGKWVVPDLTNKKLLLYTNAATPAEVTGATDQSGTANVLLAVWGYR